LLVGVRVFFLFSSSLFRNNEMKDYRQDAILWRYIIPASLIWGCAGVIWLTVLKWTSQRSWKIFPSKIVLYIIDVITCYKPIIIIIIIYNKYFFFQQYYVCRVYSKLFIFLGLEDQKRPQVLRFLICISLSMYKTDSAYFLSFFFITLKSNPFFGNAHFLVVNIFFLLNVHWISF